MGLPKGDFGLGFNEQMKLFLEEISFYGVHVWLSALLALQLVPLSSLPEGAEV